MCYVCRTARKGEKISAYLITHIYTASFPWHAPRGHAGMYSAVQEGDSSQDSKGKQSVLPAHQGNLCVLPSSNMAPELS